MTTDFFGCLHTEGVNGYISLNKCSFLLKISLNE